MISQAPTASPLQHALPAPIENNLTRSVSTVPPATHRRDHGRRLCREMSQLHHGTGSGARAVSSWVEAEPRQQLGPRPCIHVQLVTGVPGAALPCKHTGGRHSVLWGHSHCTLVLPAAAIRAVLPGMDPLTDYLTTRQSSHCSDKSYCTAMCM